MNWQSNNKFGRFLNPIKLIRPMYLPFKLPHILHVTEWALYLFFWIDHPSALRWWSPSLLEQVEEIKPYSLQARRFQLHHIMQWAPQTSPPNFLSRAGLGIREKY